MAGVLVPADEAQGDDPRTRRRHRGELGGMKRDEPALQAGLEQVSPSSLVRVPDGPAGRIGGADEIEETVERGTFGAGDDPLDLAGTNPWTLAPPCHVWAELAGALHARRLGQRDFEREWTP